MAVSVEDASPAASGRGSLHGLVVESDVTRLHNELMDAITATNIHAVQEVLCTIIAKEEDIQKAVLLSPSASSWHHLRTPLMEAASTGQMPIVGAVLAAIGDIFKKNTGAKTMVKERAKELQRQVDLVDIDGMTLLMHACSGVHPAVFQALSQCVHPSKLRAAIKARNAVGMTLLHHVVYGRSDENAPAGDAADVAPATTPRGNASTTDIEHEGESPRSAVTPARERLSTVAEEEKDADAQTSAGVPFVLDPRIPMIQCVLEFCRDKLWMPEYRKLLEARDGWHRSIVEHAIMSGNTQIFEAVFDALRRDILDDKLELMLDPGTKPSHAQTSMKRALESQRGTAMIEVVSEKTASLKSDVSKRKDDSTVASKIQGFIPGNLIVIFQLLLPEFDESSNAPLYLLLVLCFISPLWSWGAAVSIKRDPDTTNTRARQTAARHFLAIPAIFFWGIGTSKIAIYSFGWAETAGSAALAVATIVIPALDTYFSGRGVRATVSVIVHFFLGLTDRMNAKPAGDAEKTNRLFSQDDMTYRGIDMPSRTPNPVFPDPNTRLAADQNAMEAGQTPGAGASRPNLSILGQESPRSRRDRPIQSPVSSIWGDDGVESKT